MWSLCTGYLTFVNFVSTLQHNTNVMLQQEIHFQIIVTKQMWSEESFIYSTFELINRSIDCALLVPWNMELIFKNFYSQNLLVRWPRGIWANHEQSVFLETSDLIEYPVSILCFVARSQNLLRIRVIYQMAFKILWLVTSSAVASVAHLLMSTFIELINSRHQYQGVINPQTRYSACDE